ncbi:50S ribosomal protein L21 [Pasteuria penetrans]|uniref:50S ribosomal protein L21 n=1 Tax=Pasteuria penetrans TaxID=86005 RepID=UPI000FB4C7BC|nr:50S ribosomal protein L21 [Pasteuria penetrans]
MYAIVETGSKQYRVEEGRYIDVEKLPVEVDHEVRLDQVVLLAPSGEQCQVGVPYVESASVVAKVVHHGRGKKVVVFKHKPKTNYYMRKQGHRQGYTRLMVERIEIGKAT